MLCLSSDLEFTVVGIVRDTIGTGPKSQAQIILSPSRTVDSVFTEVGKTFLYNPECIELLIPCKTGDAVSIKYYHRMSLVLSFYHTKS